MKRDFDNIIEFFLIIGITSVLGNSVGILAGNVFLSFKLTVFMLALFVVPYVVLAGFIVNTGIIKLLI